MSVRSRGSSRIRKKIRRVSRLDFLLKLMSVYKNEADKCGKVRAYLAGCIILGTAIEAGLLAMADCYPDEVKTFTIYQHKKDSQKKEWRKRELLYLLDLYDLSKIAIELGWIPSNVPLNETARESGISPDDALSRGDVGYFVEDRKSVV